MIVQVSSTSDQVGLAAASSWTRGAQCAFSFFITSSTMLGLDVAPVAPRSTAYASSSTAQESFQYWVGVSCVIRRSGLSSAVDVMQALLARACSGTYNR